MKRSEVEKLIRDVITAEEGRAISYRVVIDHILPEKILDALLEVGMLPPINNDNYLENSEDDEYVINHTKGRLYKWENE